MSCSLKYLTWRQQKSGKSNVRQFHTHLIFFLRDHNSFGGHKNDNPWVVLIFLTMWEHHCLSSETFLLACSNLKVHDSQISGHCLQTQSLVFCLILSDWKRIENTHSVHVTEVCTYKFYLCKCCVTIKSIWICSNIRYEKRTNNSKQLVQGFIMRNCIAWISAVSSSR